MVTLEALTQDGEDWLTEPVIFWRTSIKPHRTAPQVLARFKNKLNEHESRAPTLLTPPYSQLQGAPLPTARIVQRPAQLRIPPSLHLPCRPANRWWPSLSVFSNPRARPPSLVRQLRTVKLAFRRQTRSDRELSRSTLGPNVRSGVSSRAGAGTRPGGIRASTARHASVLGASRGPAADRAGAASPADSVSTSGTKRKERDFDSEAGGEETNINVVVRCRGRNEREVKENSTVVVRTDGVKNKLVELVMGANALSNKTYNFDRVFSQAADQNMVFDDTVKPILDEMLAGYNCTIFAYGQTGTGKTYTMSGDMTETLGMLSDEAGIIPRVLQQLFNKLEIDDTENCVKCSFIELYNEELRDLLSIEESAKLKIFDDVSRKGHAGTIIQGMEEKHIKNASEGIKVLQDGSLKRQVAATKCNDLSSRSHTVFTITAYVKKTNEHGVDDFVSAGKLNLVDLAGSENIQRSGAENKRAAEAGLINKSLLTLGRVINALVDRSAHIPYRESKLTRLLQDSLGGRTKTCIIATISPAKSNLEETISTLDYAFRAKNIRNKPQLNPMLNKKMLLRDFASEIEKLKSELIATRQRNGVYLSNDSYEEMTAQSESRIIVMEEQAAKMETLETNLRNKVQELFSLKTSFVGLKKDHEGTRALLDDTKDVLDQTEIVLAATRKTLAEEACLRKAHEETEDKLAEIGGQLINKLSKTVHDVGGLHAKNKRKSDLQSLNRAAWGTSQGQVADVTSMVERRVLEFQDEQLEHISSVEKRMGDFVGEELRKLSATQASLDEHLNVFVDSKKQMLKQKQQSKEDMDEVLEEIKVIRDSVKKKVGESLHSISQAAEKILADVLDEMNNLHDTVSLGLPKPISRATANDLKLHNSYSSLGKDFKSIFEDLVKHITSQRSETDNLRLQLQSAMNTIVLQNAGISTRVQEALDEERRQTAEDRQKLTTQITALLNGQAESQEARLADRASLIQKSMADSNTSIEAAVSQYGQGMEAWDEKEGQLLGDVKKSREQLKTKLKDDWTAASEQSTAILNTAKSVHAETVRVVDEQIEDLDAQMEALDDFVTRARSENASHHDAHSQSVQALSNTVEQSFGNISAHFKTTFDRVKDLGDEMELDANDLRDGLEPLETQVCRPLANLREGIASTSLQEYQPTGDTPQKVMYTYPTKLPRTEPYDVLISRVDEAPPAAQAQDEDRMEHDESIVFSDLDAATRKMSSPLVQRRPSNASSLDRNPLSMSLREVNPNVTTNMTTGAISFDPHVSTMSMPADHTTPILKRTKAARLGARKGSVVEGRENLLPLTTEVFPQSMSRRKSPRLN
ncbi:Kinesin-like protein bimC [Tolypocladium ophioglossoides CBS 100239]|uniref:Kinesin-like protein bimC n=1 Tax=Tolypocladium ophioglossoides (strain CBS 100239) TaxID=1163406 RepID=A0A0L0NAS3_TOLOC|nr:Kinesin-like protein bimC [Tolypocladium ophioglossoides CBS 100239]